MMDDIHIYLPNGMRVVIVEPTDRFERMEFAFKGCLQERKWHGWSTISSCGISDINITKLDKYINKMIRGLITRYEHKLKEKLANIQLQAKYHGKVLTELELQMIRENKINSNGEIMK
ncbi:hypothetical protein [Brevibacillus laterosporus]|uniref:hypothetical protein n=1 Tax=Brevibacillus laterosporus TaxID=1465 RepID=UPI000E6BA006|nr:hypothetical protein [Brevibacillus laterosporus]AYB37608.1 hypothetical protein D5F52_04545 [Brevibacillus laterosporus]MBM7110850.1 hypothetical protein [Brevibacillus laterosporus]